MPDIEGDAVAEIRRSQRANWPSWTRNPRRRVPLLAGWSSLIAGVLLPVSLFNAAVTNHTNEGTNRTAPATAALADSDDVRAGSVAGSPVVNCAKQPDYAGQSRWVPLYSRWTDALP